MFEEEKKILATFLRPLNLTALWDMHIFWDQFLKKHVFFSSKWDHYDEIPYPETRIDTDFTQISRPN